PKVITQAKVGGALTAGAGLSPNATIPGVSGKVEGTAESNAFFENAFGTTKADIQSISTPITCNGSSDCNTKLGNVGGSPIAPFIWVNSDTRLNSNTVIGSPTNPVVLVVDGKLDLSGGVTIYGFIYVTGDVDGDGVEANGGTTVNGSLVSEKKVEFGGTVNINHSQFDTGPPGPKGPDLYVKAPGTWKDF
ncbi:MAG: hypothetical protein U1B30_02650, partial [Pseudomonadota bacterium]|nr:hypothetical protein [Pseudomonadota bacterium]